MSATPRKRVSTSCTNCRVVKRRCDKQRPSCGQCVRLRQQCPGYRDDWELVFRDQTSHTINRAKKRVNDYRGQSEPNVFAQCMDQFRRRAVSNLSSLPQAVAPGSMMGSQLFACYLENYFPSNVKPICSLDLSYTILSGIHMLPQKTTMLGKAGSALACVFLGKLHQNNGLLQYGLWLYNQAIQDMSKALSTNTYSDDIVYTCTLFGQIETHHCPESLTEWYAHIDGLSTIMQYYHPKQISSPIIAAIYDQHQKFKVVLSRLMHLSEPTISWLREPGEGLLHDLIQLLTDLSCLASFADADCPNQQDYQSLLNECMALEKRHMDFYIKINSAGDPPSYARGEFKAEIPDTDDLFGPAYKFNSVGEANLYIFLWTSLSCLYPLIQRFQSLANANVPEYLHTHHPSPQNTVHHLPVFYISKALRCLPYCTQPGMNSWSIFYGIFVAGQAARVFSHISDWERFVWAQEVVQYCARCGFDLAARLCETWWEYWAVPEKRNLYRLPYHRELVKRKEYLVPQQQRLIQGRGAGLMRR